MPDDIINRLLPFIHDEMRMPAGMIKDVIEEIERLRADRDRWFKIARDLYVWSIGILGEHMTTAEVQAYEQAVRGE